MWIYYRIIDRDKELVIQMAQKNNNYIKLNKKSFYNKEDIMNILEAPEKRALTGSFIYYKYYS